MHGLPEKRYVAIINKADCGCCLMVDEDLVPHCDCPRHGHQMWYTRRIRLTND